MITNDSRSKLGIALLLGFVAFPNQGEQVYKSVGPGGVVSYGDQPDLDAAKVEEIALPPGPTAEQVNQARADGERLEASANALEAERVAKEKAANARRAAASEEREAKAEVAEVEKLRQRQETLKEYYGYRDYKFEPLPEPKEAPPPQARKSSVEKR